MQVWVAGVALLNVKVPIEVLGLKPDPLTVTVMPFGPWAGDSVIAGAVTVKLAEAVSPATVPTLLPDALTVYDPVASDGTVKIQLNVPVAEVV